MAIWFNDFHISIVTIYLIVQARLSTVLHSYHFSWIGTLKFTYSEKAPKIWHNLCLFFFLTLLNNVKTNWKLFWSSQNIWNLSTQSFEKTGKIEFRIWYKLWNLFLQLRFENKTCLLFLLKFQLSLSFVFCHVMAVPWNKTNVYNEFSTDYIVVVCKEISMYVWQLCKTMPVDPQFSAYLIIAYLRFANYRLISLLNLQNKS